MIQFYNADSNFTLSNKKAIKLWLQNTITEEGYSVGNINIVLCTDEYLLDMNKKFLQHDYYTDIITFDYSSEGVLNGELYVSIDRIKDNALLLGQVFNRELHRVFVHGVLHLCGYKDKSSDDEKLMRSKEDFYLNKYFN